MLLLRVPRDNEVREFLSQEQDLRLSYETPGMTEREAHAGFNVDHNRVKLGDGAETFARAKRALQQWEMFNLGWVKLFWADAPIEIGAVVAVLVRHLGFWSLNASRIVYIVEQDEPVRKYGFAYGTLPGHMESGEERFTVEWHHGDDSVWYEILAFSRPKHFLAKIGYPLSRALQKRFANDSLEAMLATTTKPGAQ